MYTAQLDVTVELRMVPFIQLVNHRTPTDTHEAPTCARPQTLGADGRLCNQPALVQTPGPLLPSCVNLGKSLHLSELCSLVKRKE